jgi:hypothetical protein
MTNVGDWRLKAIMRRLGKLKGRSIDELRERACTGTLGGARASASRAYCR